MLKSKKIGSYNNWVIQRINLGLDRTEKDWKYLSWHYFCTQILHLVRKKKYKWNIDIEVLKLKNSCLLRTSINDQNFCLHNTFIDLLCILTEFYFKSVKFIFISRLRFRIVTLSFSVSKSYWITKFQD